nr:PAS domain S-box protein [Desulfobacula sp.]
MDDFTQYSIYESLFKHSCSIMLIMDPTSGRILDANLAALRFYGYSEKEILAMKISQINTLSEKK